MQFITLYLSLSELFYFRRKGISYHPSKKSIEDFFLQSTDKVPTLQTLS